MADIEKTRAVVDADETYDGRIFPTVKAELDRPVRIRDGATVQGSVYGRSVDVDADATVEGSVMAEEGVELDGGTVNGEVGTPGRVVATDARAEGTITGTRVRLRNCVVRGNVVGDEVIVENSIVLGIVTAERSLTMEETLCYTFRSHGETVLGDSTVVLPQAVADGPLTLETPVSVAGLGELDLDGESDQLPEMTDADVHDRDGTTYLTLAPRLLNLEKVRDNLDELEEGIMAAVDDTSGDGGAEMSVSDVLGKLGVDHEQIAAD
jgi:cytoskeletal protein CcmA (bactofilin family)